MEWGVKALSHRQDLKAARREGCSPLLSRQPHHFASLYSNSGGVLHYLVRVPPFTGLFLNYQGADSPHPPPGAKSIRLSAVEYSDTIVPKVHLFS